MKRCLYCLRGFDGRGRCCSQWCARKVTGHRAWITRSRNEALRARMEEIQRRLRFIPRFRQLAMGAEPAEHLAAIFGAEPADITPRHGDTLDS